jgi:hypothetical protein
LGEFLARFLGLEDGGIQSIGEGYAVLITGILVVIGWYITHRSATNIARHGTAHKYIIANNKEITDLISSLAGYLQKKHPFPDPFIDTGEKDTFGRPVFAPNSADKDLDTIKLLLTKMEIISTDIRFGLVSERYILSAQRSLIVNLFRVSKKYIHNLRYVRGQPTAFENFEILFIRCEYAKYNLIVKIIEYVYNKPLFGLSIATFKLKYRISQYLGRVSEHRLLDPEDKIKLAIEICDKWSIFMLLAVSLFAAFYFGLLRVGL